MGLTQVRRLIKIIWAVIVRRPLTRQRERKKINLTNSIYIAQKSGETTHKSYLQQCPVCGRSFKRLDVQLCLNQSRRDPLVDKSTLDTQFQQSQSSNQSRDVMPLNQDQSAGASASHSDSTTSECLKPPLKLPPNNVLEAWSRADEFIT